MKSKAPFQSFKGFLEDDQVLVLRSACEEVFTAEAKEKGATYSSGQTFWVGADDTPMNELEAFAKRVFNFHTEGMATFDRSKSGVEFWPLVLDVIDAVSGDRVFSSTSV